MSVYDNLKNVLNFQFITACNAACKLIIITGGRAITATGYLRKHLTDIGNVEGLDFVASSLASVTSTLHSTLNPYITCSMPTIGEGLDDLEKCLAYLNGIDAIVDASGDGADSVTGEDVDSVCGILAFAANGVEEATYAFMG